VWIEGGLGVSSGCRFNGSPRELEELSSVRLNQMLHRRP